MLRAEFTIHGKPFAKQRHRTTKTGHTYTPKGTVSFESVVREIGAKAFEEPLKGPVKMCIHACFQIPKSRMKGKDKLIPGQYHIQKPDSDNLQKAIGDGLNRIAFVDDCQVAIAHCRKTWGTEEYTTVAIYELEDNV